MNRRAPGARRWRGYAQRTPTASRASCCVRPSSATRSELEGAFIDVPAALYPDLSDDFLKLLPPEERAQPLDAYWRGS